MAEASEPCVLSTNDTFISDVHRRASATPSEKGTIVSRFVIHSPGAELTCEHSPCSVAAGVAEEQSALFDEDGDVIVSRSSSQHDSQSNIVLHIEHALCATQLCDVGQQVWSGALIMSDYILHNRKQFKGRTVLELGAGVGVVSLIAYLSDAKCILCTDIGATILDICNRNVTSNMDDLELSGEIRVLELDWKKPFHSVSSTSIDQAMYSWTSEDFKNLANADYILATDAIYDDSITEAFFWCLVKCVLRIKNPELSIIISLEKRINFTLEALAPASPAYDFFRQCLEMTYATDSGRVRFEAHQVPVSDIPKYLDYDRVQEMVTTLKNYGRSLQSLGR